MQLSKQKMMKMLAGALAGLIFGGTLGFMLGGVFGGMGSLFKDMFLHETSFLIFKIILGAVIGILLGASVVAMSNRLLNSDEKNVVGLVMGGLIGILVGLTGGTPLSAPWDIFDLIIFAGMIGLGTGGLTGLVTALYTTARSREPEQISVEEKKKNDDYAAYMKQRLNK